MSDDILEELEEEILYASRKAWDSAQSGLNANFLGRVQDEIERLRAENEKLQAERDNFYIEYRMVCDEECKIVHAEVEKLRTATTELLSHYYDAMRRDGYADEEVRSEHVFLAAVAALKETGDE